MKTLSKITIIGVITLGFAHAADITALTDATVKLIKNQTITQGDLQRIHAQINILDAKIERNTIFVKNTTNLANKVKALAESYNKTIQANKNAIQNIQVKNKMQDNKLKQIAMELSQIKEQLNHLNSTMKINQKTTSAQISMLQKNMMTRISDVKTILENQIQILKSEFNSKLKDLKNKLNKKIVANANNIKMNTVNLNALKIQHNNDIALLKQEFNNKIESVKKVLQGEIDIITAKLQGLGPIVVVNEGENKPVKNHPVKCQNKNCAKKVKKADKIIKNFLNK